MKVHHVGYLVKKLDKAAEEFEKLGFVRQGDMTNDTYRKVDILFLEKDGYVVELVSPNAPDSVVSGLIKTYKNAPYHICYESADFQADLEQLTQNGYVQIDQPARSRHREPERGVSHEQQAGNDRASCVTAQVLDSYLLSE